MMKPVFDEQGLATEAGNIRCFYFDGVTFEYTGWSDEYINLGVSMPGNSTTIEPGDSEDGKVWVFTNGAWSLKEDRRGEIEYSVTTLQASMVRYIGPAREGFTFIKPTTIFDTWDGVKWVTDTEAEKAAQVVENTHRKAALIAEATAMIAPLQDAKDGGYIDDEDIPVLAAWQKYRYALTKVDPANPAWPERPGQ